MRTTFLRPAGLAIATTTLFLLSACGPNSPPRFQGLRSGTAASFVLSPDGCALSLLFDNTLQWHTDDTATVDKKTLNTRFELLVMPAGTVTHVIIDLRGNIMNAGVPADALKVSLGGVDIPLGAPLTVDEGNFFRRIEGTLTADKTITPMTVTLTLPRPSPEAASHDSLLALDSVDVIINDATGSKPCVARAPEEAAKEPVSQPPKP